MTDLYLGTPKITNVLSTLLQNKLSQDNLKEQRDYEKTTPNYLLAQKQVENYDADRNYLLKQREEESEDKKISRMHTAFNAAVQASTPEQAKGVYKALLPDGPDVDFSFVGATKDKTATVKMTFENGAVIEGPRDAITEMTSEVAKDPTWYTDAEKKARVMAWGSARGISVTLPKQEDSEAPKTREVQKGDQKITQEWDATNKAWKDVASGPAWKPETGGADANQTQLDNIKKTYLTTIGRANSAKMKVGQYVPDTNSDEVAAQEYDKAALLAKKYQDLGGDIADLGLSEVPATGNVKKKALNNISQAPARGTFNSKLTSTDAITSQVADAITKGNSVAEVTGKLLKLKYTKEEADSIVQGAAAAQSVADAGSKAGIAGQEGADVALPDPASYAGKTIRDTVTGKRYTSNGTAWSEVQ